MTSNTREHWLQVEVLVRDSIIVVAGPIKLIDSAKGICLALVKALHAQGCHILIADLVLHREAIEWLKTSEATSGPKIIFQEVDVTLWQTLEDLFDDFARLFGGAPEIVVAGAGIYEASSAGFWDEEDDASHYKLFDINLLHPIRLTRIAIRRLQRAKSSGVILHISSITAQKPSVVLPLYSVSKAAISQFVRCMAPLQELAQIRVVAVAPGVVDTPLFHDHPKALDHIDVNVDFILPRDEVVKAMMAMIVSTKYASGTVLEIGDIGEWREVQLLNDCGPQGRSTVPRVKAKDAIMLVQDAMRRDRGHA